MFYRFIKKALLASAAVSVLFLTGCSLGMSADSLLSSPRLSDEQNAIYEALTGSVDKNISLKYPKTGDYRSAFVVADIDSEPTDEAIVFYEITGESEGEGNVRINVLDQIDGKWVSVYDHAGTGTEIDSVMFETLGSTGTVNILIGFNTLTKNEKMINIYRYSDRVLSLDYSSAYDAYYVMDIDSDEEDELAVIYNNKQEMQSYVALIENQQDNIYQSDSVLLSPDSSGFTNINWGYIGKSTPALYIDSLKNGNKLTTEIIYCVNGRLRNPFYPKAILSLDEVSRPADYSSADIDSDGVIEIPTVTELPGYNDQTEKLYTTNWNVFENYSVVKKYSSFYNPDDGYCFMMPSRWDGVVTAKTDSATGELIFYKYKDSLKNSTIELMRISVVKNSDGSSVSPEGYDRIETTKDAVYLFKIPADEDEPLILTSAEIRNNFYTIP